MQDLARKNGGKCLSDKYIRAHSHLLWECAYGHQWEATYANINSGCWCPRCRNGISEEMCRFMLEQMLGVEFKKNRTVLCGLELDGYNAEMKLAFEHQGCQHYKFMPHWHKTREVFEKQVRRDIAKEELCSIKDINLLVIPYFAKPFVEYIRSSLQEMNITIVNSDVDMSLFRTPYQKQLDTLNDAARSRGGQCLSDFYTGLHTKMKWQCSRGHQWETTPASILHGGTWCRQCAGLGSPDIQAIQQLAQQRGGRCLSTEYRNSRTKLEWECEEGHIWETSYTVVRAGHWCPVCGKKESWEKRKSANV